MNRSYELHEDVGLAAFAALCYLKSMKPDLDEPGIMELIADLFSNALRNIWSDGNIRARMKDARDLNKEVYDGAIELVHVHIKHKDKYPVFVEFLEKERLIEYK